MNFFLIEMPIKKILSICCISHLFVRAKERRIQIVVTTYVFSYINFWLNGLDYNLQ